METAILGLAILFIGVSCFSSGFLIGRAMTRLRGERPSNEAIKEAIGLIDAGSYAGRLLRGDIKPWAIDAYRQVTRDATVDEP